MPVGWPVANRCAPAEALGLQGGGPVDPGSSSGSGSIQWGSLAGCRVWVQPYWPGDPRQTSAWV
jgi:hypothetical protein